MHQPRVLVLSPWGLGGGYSGPLTLLDRLGAALTEAGATIDVAYRDRGSETAPSWVRDSIRLGTGGAFDRREQLRWARDARRLLSEKGDEYDIVHLHGFYLANQLAAWGFRGSATVVALPVLEGGDLGNASDTRRHGLKMLGLRLAARSVRHGFALSDRIAHDLTALGVPAASVTLIGNPADSAAFRVGAARTAQHSSPMIGFVGKVGGFKNPELVVDAIASMRASGLDARGLIVGPFENDGVREKLEQLVKHHQLAQSVMFTGFTRQVADKLALMDVFVLPSDKEGLPGALCEAMASGLPCVVTDVGSMATHVRAAECGAVVQAEATSVLSGIYNALGDNWTVASRRSHHYAKENFSAQAIAKTYLTSLAPVSPSATP